MDSPSSKAETPFQQFLSTLLRHEEACLDFVEDPLADYVLRLRQKAKVESFEKRCERGYEYLLEHLEE